MMLVVLQMAEITSVFKIFSSLRSAFSHRSGFTLIELLVATSLLILLSTVVIASFRQANITSRDAKRKADLQLIRGALESYRLENGFYPRQDDPGLEGVEVNSLSGVMITTLGLTNFSNGEVNDPANAAPYYYRYTVRNEPGCPYELGAVMESDNNIQTCAACNSTPPEGNYFCVAN